MPAAAVFLAGGGVLRADHGRAADLPARDADVTTDAHADIVDAAFINLAGQPGIGDARARRADDVELAGTDHLGHFFGIGEATDTQHRFLGHLFNELLPRNLMALTIKTRRPCILAPLRNVSYVDIPNVNVRISQFEELHAVHFNLDGIGPI